MDRNRLRLSRFVWIVLAAALALRIGVMLAAFMTAEPLSGDGPFYIRNAQQPWRLGLPDSPDNVHRHGGFTTSIGPVYPIFLMPAFLLIPDSAPVAQMMAVRLAQAFFDTLTVLFVYLIARRLFGERPGQVALVMQALDLRYIFSAGVIATETLFIALFTGFMLACLSAAAPASGRPWGRYRLAGLLLGLALLTRPVPFLFPLLLVPHALLTPARRTVMLRGIGWLAAVTLLVVMPWMVRTAILTGDLLPVSDTAFVHFWRASRDDGSVLTTGETMGEAIVEDMGPRQPGERTTSTQYVQAAARNILSAPAAWLRRVAADTLDAYLQPYGTVILRPRGAAVKQVLLAFLSGEASLNDVLSVPALGRRLLMYIWHYWALLGGIAGLVLAIRQHWRELFPLLAWVAYVTAVISVLLIEPRYLFPTMFVFTVLAAYASVRAWDALRARGWLPRFLRPESLAG